MAPRAQDADSVEPRWSDLLAGRNAIYSLTFSGGVGLHALNIYVVTTIMPSVIADIGGLALYAWSTTVFIVASVVSAALTASFLRRAGPRSAYVLAAALFALGTVICACAPTMPVLLAGRCVQGFGGGLLYSLTYAVVRIVYPRQLWSRAIGMESAIWGVATLVGPAVGGIFAEMGSWRSAFWTMLPFAIAFGAVAYVMLPAAVDDDQSNDRVAWPQILLLSMAIFMLSASSLAGSPLVSAAGLGAALALLAGAVLIERSSRNRLLPTGSLGLATHLGAAYCTAALLMIGMQVEVFMPYLLQVLHAQTPLAAGYLAALPAIGWTLGAIATAGLLGAAERNIVRFGPVVSFLGCALLAIALPMGASSKPAALTAVCAGLVLLGTGIGAVWPHLVARIYQHAPAGERERASGAITTVQLSATACGAAAGGLIVNISGIASGGEATAAFWLCALLAVAPLIGAGSALLLTRKS